MSKRLSDEEQVKLNKVIEQINLFNDSLKRINNQFTDLNDSVRELTLKLTECTGTFHLISEDITFDPNIDHEKANELYEKLLGCEGKPNTIENEKILMSLLHEAKEYGIRMSFVVE